MTPHGWDTFKSLLCHSIQVLLVIASVSLTCADGLCKAVSGSNCKCKTDTGEVLDLSPLVDTSAFPLFSNVTGSIDHALYSYKPCVPMSVPVGDSESPCHNVAVCRLTKDGMLAIGAPEPVEFLEDPQSVPYIQYKGNVSITKVYLFCSTEEKFLAVKGQEPGENIYTMSLWTKYACFSDGGLSVGSILLILFFVSVLVYLTGGIILLRCVRGARGFEQIPHYDFWLDFPALVKDGVLFVSRGCKSDSDRTYEPI